MRTVAVVGGGPVAMAAALAFARALPRAEVTLIGTPVDPAALSDHLPVLLESGRAHLALLGLDEDALLARALATPRLAERFEDWGGAPWLSAPGEAVAIPGSGAVHQRWLRIAGQAGAPPFHALLPAAAMAEAGVFAAAPPAPLDRAGYDLRLDAAGLAAALAQGLRAHKVRMVATERVVANSGADGIASVTLDNGEPIAADLFVDAAGPGGMLAQPEDGWEDWTPWLPADRLLLAPEPAGPDLLDRYRAVDCGWAATWPRARDALRVLAFDADATTPDRARRVLGRGGEAATLVALEPGRGTGWSGNRLALGDAAVQLGPLGLAGFDLAMAQLALALALLPGRAMPPLLLAEYNRRANLRADRLRDWLSAHYLAAPVRKGPFWHRLPQRAASPALGDNLGQFRQRGFLPHHDEESVAPDRWRAVLLGQGIRPRRADPVALADDPAGIHAAIRAGAESLRCAAAALSVGTGAR
nr:tryptophan 7-halogenase [Sphingomonas xinjiangensis]